MKFLGVTSFDAIFVEGMAAAADVKTIPNLLMLL